MKLLVLGLIVSVILGYILYNKFNKVSILEGNTNQNGGHSLKPTIPTDEPQEPVTDDKGIVIPSIAGREMPDTKQQFDEYIPGLAGNETNPAPPLDQQKNTKIMDEWKERNQMEEQDFEKDVEIRNEGRQNDPGGVLDIPNESSEMSGLTPGGFHADGVDISGNVRDTTKVVDKSTAADGHPLHEDIKACNEITSCDGIVKGCGYCITTDKFLYGDKDGPMTDVCPGGKKNWTTELSKCKQAQDDKLCNAADSCADLQGRAVEVCGYCPTTGKIMPMKTSGNKLVPKYGSDTCSYEKGLLKADKCAQFAKDHPCITPYMATGPHSENCLRKLWKNSKCSGSNPYNKSFGDLKEDKMINKGSHSGAATVFGDLYNKTKSKNLVELVESYPLCHNQNADVDVCDSKYTIPFNDQTLKANELCKKKLFKEAGCKPKGNMYPDKLKATNENNWRTALQKTASQYKNDVQNIMISANKEISDESEYAAKEKASLNCYGVKPAKPDGKREGDYISYKWKGYGTLYGYLIQKSNDGKLWQVLWMKKSFSNGLNKERKNMTQKEQKEEFGWHGIKAKHKNMKDVGNEDGEIRGNTDMKVLERCTPGNSLCGNSCNEVITNLEDKYPRPQDCVVGDWGSWGKCTRECGGGTQTRERKIKYEAKRGGVPCKDKKFDTHLQETQTCNVRPCTNPNFKLTDEATLTGKNGDTIEIRSNDYIHIQELQAYDSNNLNVALKNKGANAAASDTGWRGHVNYPIDGVKRSHYHWPNSVHTGRGLRNGKPRWYKVYLPKTNNITRIVVHNRPDCCQSRLDGAQLLLWDTKNFGSTPKLVFRARLNSNMKQIFLLGSSREYSAYQGNPGEKTAKCGTYTTDDQSTTYNTFKDTPWYKGDGVGGSEKYVGYASTKEDCARLVRERAPTANGATMPYTYRGKCYAEYGMTGRNNSSYWHSTMFNDAPPKKKTEKALRDSVKKWKSNKGKSYNPVKKGTCFENQFKKSPHYPTGGDCDWWTQKWWGWGSRKWPVEKCAEKCSQDPNCKRFSHGTQNFWGGPGLGCRTSTGGYNDGYCAITTDRYKANGWNWWGTYNLWGGQVYDKIDPKTGKLDPKGGRKPKEYIGDFRDWYKKGNRNSKFSGRDLPKWKWYMWGWGPGNDSMTCAYRCRDYKYFGMQWWGQCFCGNEYGKHYQHTDNKGKNSNYHWRHPWARWWTYYGGWRNKVYRTPRASREEWKHCANDGGNCDPGQGNKNYIIRYGNDRGWTQFKGKGREKCSASGRWGVKNIQPSGAKVCQWKPF